MRTKLFNQLAKFISEKTGWALFSIIIITLITGYLSSKIKINMNMADLLPKNSPMMEEFNYVAEHFPGANPMIIVLQGDEEKMKIFAEGIKNKIENLSAWIERFGSPKIQKQHEMAKNGSNFPGKYYRRVDIKLPTKFFEDHGLMLLKNDDLKRMRKLYEEPGFLPFLINLNDNLEKEYIQSEEKISTMQKEREAVQFLDNIETWSDFVNRALFELEYDKTLSQEAARSFAAGSPYLYSPDRSMMLVMAEPTFNVLDIEKLLPAVNGLEELVKKEAAKYGIGAGLAGGIVLARDEMVASTEDSFLLTLLALTGVFLLFIIAFRMISAPFLAILNLLLGIVWALGISYLLVEELNMFTSMASVVLVGLGIDFSIHIISVYSEMRRKGENIYDALGLTLNKVGAGIITGGMTTAVAFLTLTTGRSSGIVEFGLVNGIGLVIVMLATLLILPTFLILQEKLRIYLGEKLLKNFSVERKSVDISYKLLGSAGDKIYKKYGVSLIGILIITTILGFSMTKVEFDYNYLNMEPEGLESIRLNHLLIHKYNMSSDPTMMTAKSLQENYNFTQKAKEQSSISWVQSITDYLPPIEKQQHRKPLIAEIHRIMENSSTNLSFSEDYQLQVVDELMRLEANIIEMQDMAFISGQDMVDQKTFRLVGSANFTTAAIKMDELVLEPTTITKEKTGEINRLLAQVLNENFPVEVKEILRKIIREIQKTDIADIGRLKNIANQINELAAHPIMAGKITALANNLNETVLEENRLEIFSRDFAGQYKNIVLDMADTNTIKLEMLPVNTRDQFYSPEEDCFLITVYPKGNVWNIQYLDTFSKDLLDITPRIAGLPPMFYYLIDIIGQDGKKAAVLTLIVVFIMLLIDFRSIKFSFLALLPLIIGFIWMLGIMGILGIKITLVNVMALPLILGIGIDDGIHILHRYRSEGKGAIRHVLSSTGKAVVITSLTTMISFGSLVFATYRGFGSLGIALFIGVGTCLLASVFVLTPMIRLFRE
ncbi:MAG: MMPL family transporter [Candidatus Marinimicrobia bacterium]|nr:MMPL family transporter [Candidatus Neomarinimicrobiota bacterium]